MVPAAENEGVGRPAGGRKQDALDYHKGTLHDATENDIEFQLEGEPAAVNRAKVFGLVYRGRRDLPEPIAGSPTPPVRVGRFVPSLARHSS